VTNPENVTRRSPGRRFRPRKADLENGETLVLNADGSIEHRDAAGAAKRTWNQDDPEWASHAIRFGLHEAPSTAPPSGRYVPGSKPPPW
jgi:hypothetical protein